MKITTPHDEMHVNVNYVAMLYTESCGAHRMLMVSDACFVIDEESYKRLAEALDAMDTFIASPQLVELKLKADEANTDVLRKAMLAGIKEVKEESTC